MYKRAIYPPDVLSRLQCAELEILDVVAALCSKHDIHWFLDGGTALGAVRHKGFIPWDDDIDIGMLDEEYERFLQAARQELPAEYELHVPGEGDYYAPAFSKICKVGTKFWTQETIDAGFDQGIFLDIFPYGAVSKNPKRKRRQFSGAKRYTRMLYLYQSGNISYPTNGLSGAFLKTGFRIAHFVLSHSSDAPTLYRKYLKAIHCATDDASDESAIFSWPTGGCEKTSVIATTVDADFEGRRYPIPKDYVAHFTWMYDEKWMKLPPEKQRKSHAPIILDFGDGLNALDDQ